MVQSTSEETEEVFEHRVVVADRDLQTLSEDLPLYLGLKPVDLTSLTRLTICNTKLTHVPAALGLLSSLTRLDLVDNQLCDLPEELGQLRVKRFVVAGNRLGRLPACFFLGLADVRELDLSRNVIEDLLTPPLCASKLQGLDFSHNRVPALPEWLSTSCGALRRLRAAHNAQLSGAAGGGALRGPLRALDVSSCTVSALDFLGGLQGLAELHIGNNVAAPATAATARNCFWDFPEGVLRLASTLTVLSIRGTCLSQLPPEIRELRSLTLLDLTDCQLQTLPKELGQLTGLRYLLLSRNALVALPDSVGDLGSLRQLRLDGNQMELLPDSLSRLSGLELLDLYDNCLDQWQPSWLDSFSSLQGIDFERNFCPAENTERYERLRRCLRLRLDVVYRLEGCKVEEELPCENDESYDSDGYVDDSQLDATDEPAEWREPEPEEADSDWGGSDQSESDDDKWSPPEKCSVGSLQRVTMLWLPPLLAPKTFVQQNCTTAEGQFAELAGI